MPIQKSVLDFIQSAPKEIVSNAIIGLIGDTYSPTQVYILWGIYYNAGIVSDGAVFYGGEVYKYNSQTMSLPYYFYIGKNIDEVIRFSDGSNKEALIENYVFLDSPGPYNIGNGIRIPNLIDLDTTTVKLSGNQTIAGVKTFSSFPLTPSSAPTTNYQTANKKYVDDGVAGAISTAASDATSKANAAESNANTFSTNLLNAKIVASGTELLESTDNEGLKVVSIGKTLPNTNYQVMLTIYNEGDDDHVIVKSALKGTTQFMIKAFNITGGGFGQYVDWMIIMK